MFVGGAMGSFAELLGQVQKALGASVRLREIIDEPIEHDAQNTIVHSEKLHSISIQNVSFNYPNRKDIQALKDIHLTIPAGHRIAFVGESGAGKVLPLHSFNNFILLIRARYSIIPYLLNIGDYKKSEILSALFHKISFCLEEL